jgi:hypothetical protein
MVRKLIAREVLLGAVLDVVMGLALTAGPFTCLLGSSSSRRTGHACFGFKLNQISRGETYLRAFRSCHA